MSLMSGSAPQTFPFSAIVGQDAMKLALLLNAVNPAIGGLLIRGEKGTAKSTAARALTTLLPELDVVMGCPFSCAPSAPFPDCPFCSTTPGRQPTRRQVRLVELPVSATEEAVVGSLDIETAIKEGRRRFEPGLLAAAHRGILYIDEVNLLNDHVVDVLLDAAAMGRNYVEREGVSFGHPAAFILIGTMNPEEGELRPQFIDRFGLAVQIERLDDPDRRTEVVRRRMAYEEDAAAFAARWADEESRERERVLAAVALLPSVTVSDELLVLMARLCAEHQVDGLRADIVMHKAARTVTAYRGRTTVTPEDVMAVAEMALLHRMRRQPFDEPTLDRDRLKELAEEIGQKTTRRQEPETGDATPPEPPPDSGEDSSQDGEQSVAQAGQPFQVRPLNLRARDRRQRPSLGRRTTSQVQGHHGRYVRAAVPHGKVTDLALDATLRAAAPMQVRRQTATLGNLALQVEPWDLRQKERESKVGNLIVFVVDASGSMGAQRRMESTKGAVASLLLDAYQRRDQVALIAFRGARSEVVLPPTGSAQQARRSLEEIPTGGRTPLAHALLEARKLIVQQRQRDPNMVPLMVLLSDGRANVGVSGGDPFEEAMRIAAWFRAERVETIALDPAPRANRFGLMPKVASALGGRYMPVDDLRADVIQKAVRSAQEKGL